MGLMRIAFELFHMGGWYLSLGNWLEQRSGVVFLGAGGLMLVTIVLGTLDMMVTTSLEEPAGIAAIAGIVFSIVGLLGLYPRLADAAPRQARVGLLLLILPAIYLIAALVWTIPTIFLPEWPALTALLPGDAVGLIFILFAGGITIFGVVGLRTAVPSRTVGGFLLVLAAAWFIVLGAEIVYEPIPDWVVPTMIVLMTVSLLSIGYLLQIETGVTDRTESPPDSIQ